MGALDVGDDDVVDLGEESEGQPLESFKKRKKTVTPSLSKPGPATLLEVKKDIIEERIT